MNLMVRDAADLETQIVSAERVQEYSYMDSEVSEPSKYLVIYTLLKLHVN